MVTCVIIIIMFFVNHISPGSAPYSNPVGGGNAPFSWFATRQLNSSRRRRRIHWETPLC